MEGAPFQKWIVLLLFKAIRSPRAFLVPRGHVTRDWFAQRFCLGAFESDNFLRHFGLFFRLSWRGFFFLGLATFLIG